MSNCYKRALHESLVWLVIGAAIMFAGCFYGGVFVISLGSIVFFWGLGYFCGFYDGWIAQSVERKP